MRGATAAALLAALLIATPASAAGGEPDVEQTLTDVLAEVPDVPSLPRPEAIAAATTILILDLTAYGTQAVFVAEGAATHAVLGALAAVQTGTGPVEAVVAEAAAETAAAVDASPAACWLEQGFGCAGWVVWYYPGAVVAVLAMEHDAEAAALATFDAAMVEYYKFPGTSPTPGLVLTPGQDWAEAASLEVPAYLYGTTQHTLEVADSFTAPGAPDGDMDGYLYEKAQEQLQALDGLLGFGIHGGPDPALHEVQTCEALECDPAYVLQRCIDTCAEEALDQVQGMMSCQAVTCDPVYPEKALAFYAAGEASWLAQAVPTAAFEQASVGQVLVMLCATDTPACIATVGVCASDGGCFGSDAAGHLSAFGSWSAGYAEATSAGGQTAVAEAAGAGSGAESPWPIAAPVVAFVWESHHGAASDVPWASSALFHGLIEG